MLRTEPGLSPPERPLSTVAIHYEHDVVLARQRARQIAGLLGFDTQDQVRVATAVSEIARNAFRYARGGKAEFAVLQQSPPVLRVRVTDQGPGIANLQDILDGRYVSQTGLGMGMLGARRLMDDFEVTSSPGAGTRVVLAKSLPKRTPPITDKAIADLTAQLAKEPPQDPFEELQRQNQELLATLEEVQRQRTELAQLNRELEDTNRGVVALYAEQDERADYLRRASELKTQFLSNMSHEFRTPLNSILSLARILLDRMDGELSSEQERQVRFIQRAATDLSELVNDLLDLAKVEAGKLTIRPGDFKVQDLFAALRGMLRPLLARNSTVALTFDAAPDLPALHTDESKISQILRNLISNALKYTERGEVAVKAYQEDPSHMAFVVSDTGIGIAPDDQERIFEEFTQVEGDHQRGKRGTGLGLPLSRKLAHLVGGTLTLQSAPGLGSTFTLRVPMTYQGAREVSVEPELPREIDPSRLPVLVVEDNPETLFGYEEHFTGTPFQPIPARSFQQARLALGRFRPTAIILDSLRPQYDTWGLLGELKQNPATRDIYLLVVAPAEHEQKARALGANAFHSKPIDRPWLLGHLSACLPQASLLPEVLIIDDDEASRYVLSGFLGPQRFRVVEAARGSDGLELARERKPAAIFLDLKMPGLNGFKVLDALKADGATSSIPVIIHTAKTLTTTDRKKLEGRTIAIIPKNHEDRQASAIAINDALALAQPSNPPTRT